MRSTETTQCKGEKKYWSQGPALRGLRASKRIAVHHFSPREKHILVQKKILKEIMTQNIPNLVKDIFFRFKRLKT